MQHKRKKKNTNFHSKAEKHSIQELDTTIHSAVFKVKVCLLLNQETGQ